MKTLQILAFLALCFQVLYSCKDYDLESFPKNDYRIKTIVDFESDEARERTEFYYNNDRLIAWKKYLINDAGTWQEIEIAIFEYCGETVSMKLRKKHNNEYSDFMNYSFRIKDRLIIAKNVSRLASPICSDCWNYLYTYSNNKLTVCDKQIRTSTNNWETCRKQVYNYMNNRVVECFDYNNYDHTDLKLDYIKKYNYSDNRLAGWICGTVVENQPWFPTQKIELLYDADKIVSREFYAWNAYDSIWYFKGLTTYQYMNDLLVEESSQGGQKTIYTYEPGSGNAALFYYEPDCLLQTKPLLKSVTFANNASTSYAL